MATKHMVTCQQCGRRFNANSGYYYNNKSKRYTCKSCGKKLEASKRQSNTGMKQTYFAMFAKIFIGFLMIFAGFHPKEGESPLGYFLFCFVIGAAILAWGLVPFILAKLKKKEKTRIYFQADVEPDELAKNLQRKCKACGALTSGDYCEYCGSPLD